MSAEWPGPNGELRDRMRRNRAAFPWLHIGNGSAARLIGEGEAGFGGAAPFLTGQVAPEVEN